MAWLFQGVLNAGLQILLSIFGGWLCARLKLVDPEVMSRNVNAFAMKAAYPAFIIHLLGVKTNLQDTEAWRALGVFVLWVFIIHLTCYLVHKLQRQHSNVLQLGLNCLLLTTNNTGCIGWPVLIATVGQQSAVLSMLLGVLFFIQLLPVTISCFESHKWQQQDSCYCKDGTDIQAGDHLPLTQQEALPAAATSFPHEFRYCYWSNELYQPTRSSGYRQLPEHSQDRRGAPSDGLVEVRVVDTVVGMDNDLFDHHCFGGGSAVVTASSILESQGKPVDDASSISIGGSRVTVAPASEWWRSGRPYRPVSGGLKRAKDSCDSLYTPFAAAAVAAKQAELDQQSVQSPKPSTLGLSSLTRRLSRGLSAATAIASAAATAAAFAASPKPKRAESLHTATGEPPVSRMASLKRMPSLRASTSSRRPAAARAPLCQMSVPLMEEQSGAAPSCCRSHDVAAAQPDSDSPSVTSSAPSCGTSQSASTTSRCNMRISSVSDSGSSSESGSSSTTCDANVSSKEKAALGQIRHWSGTEGSHLAAASAVELHRMCLTHADALQLSQQQQQQQQDAQHQSQYVNAAAGIPTAVTAAWHLGGVVSLHTLPGDEMCGRTSSDTGNSDTCRVSSTTNLLHAAFANSKASKTSSKLSRAAGPQNADIPKAHTPHARGGSWCCHSFVGSFAKSHPLFCHIVWNQVQSFHLWLNLLAIALSVSGARRFLDPASPEALPALGFVDGVLSWFSAACIPTLLFANGVWMYGKDILCGGWRGQLQVWFILLLKLTLLPALMVALTQLCKVRGEYGLSLVLLASCPLAPLAFLVCQQYNFGAEVATSITIQGVLLMLPQMMAVIKLNQLAGLYEVDLLGS